MLTSSVKDLLRRTIQDLRDLLLKKLDDSLDGAYQLGAPIDSAKLGDEQRQRRRRLEGWIDERVRASGATKKAEVKAAVQRFREQAVKEAAYTLINRLVVLRILEEDGHIKPRVVTGGWASPGYQSFIAFAPAVGQVRRDDATEGYALLLRLVMDEWAAEMPGLFADIGIARLVPIPADVLREAVERLSMEALEPAWRDDTTLGWVYQFWNDPDREALDKKLNARQKLQPHEVASKTQMFTERYIVEWLLQNSLGLMWLAICKKNDWTPEAESVLANLETRREAWRARREASEVALDELMPIADGLEDRWKYFVPQALPPRVVETAPTSIRDLKILDPACGSGHFLVIAFDLLAALYREEARHRGDRIADEEIARSIVERNLFGVDIDPRAVQIAAAALVLKAKRVAPTVILSRLNLVAPAFDVAGLPKDDPARTALRERLEREVGVRASATDNLIDKLAGVGHLGTLLRLDKALEYAVATAKNGDADTERRVEVALEEFLSAHTSEADLGLRLDGEQIAAGVRFIRMVREGTYDVVVGNPPYQGTKKMAEAGYVAQHYPRAKADLFAAFLQRGLELAREGGISALLTMRAWMFLTQYTGLRREILLKHDLRSLTDLDSGAFEDVAAAQVVLSVAASVLVRGAPAVAQTVALRPTAREDRASAGMIDRKRAGLVAQVGRHDFDAKAFEVIDGQPLVYWWSKDFLARYASAPKLGDIVEVRQGLATSGNLRFLRKTWEVQINTSSAWAAYVKGAAGRAWFEPREDAIRWAANGLECKTLAQRLYGSYTRTIKNEGYYFRIGLAFSMIGAEFSARLHRVPSIIADKGSSVYGGDRADLLCSMNRTDASTILSALNPSVSFQVGDVNRLPFVCIDGAREIVGRLETVFAEHEAAREASLEFVGPGPSCWRSAQEWAQRAVDRPDGTPLPRWEPEYDAPESAAFVSFALGIALGRFGANGEGIFDDAPETALPGGIVFLSAATEQDSLGHAASRALVDAWTEHGTATAPRDDLRSWLRKSYFNWHKHNERYDSRPIYFPLSSARRTFVAWVSIHRWRSDTLSVLLAEHLLPERAHLEGALDDVLAEVSKGKANAKAERRLADVQAQLAELDEFISTVREVADRGPPPVDGKTTPREVDAGFEMDLDDGVMINSAALWPLLDPQWSKPKQWWKELANAEGKKDYDWSHVAARYFPKRVAKKCVDDPSLAVAHGCFWRLHPALAYAWELRLQDEIRPDFTIDETGSDASRARFLAEHAEKAEAIRQKEEVRRRRKSAKESDEQPELDLDPEEDDEAVDDDD
ncbi:MAG TPA: BREX-6 system adenine-specific DNA-methyltransferase PglX [Nannocystaceae bacterium]|nr:BREX-6 system adenine-specific DNA-methyltransferase PglX [Nannocystaceae bacterium]